MKIRTGAAALAAATALLLGTSACSSDEPTDDKDSQVDTTDAPDEDETDAPEPEETEEAEEAEASEEDPDALDAPLSEELTTDSPGAWALPVIDGWSPPSEQAAGVFQITKDGSDTVVTAYQMADADSSDAEQGARQWLDNYHSQIADNPAASDVTEPTYGFIALDSTLGSMEFVSQELSYTAGEDRYRSFYAARWIDGYLYALQYAALEDEWSEEELWDLTEQGLQLAI